MFNHFIVPITSDICQKYAITKVNNEINNITDEIINSMNIKTSDLTNEINTNELSHINLNSILVNTITNKVGANLSKKMNTPEYNNIQIPIGVFSGIPMLSQIDFKIPVNITSIGDAKVDYETSLTSAGVNQVSYQVWLNIECDVSIVSPVFSKNVNIKRKLLLVNTVFNGKVPNGYANINLK